MDDLTTERAKELLETLATGHLGTVLDGDPYVTPISYVVIGEEVLFRTMPGDRLRAITSHPQVCLEASESDFDGNWESVIITGAAYIVEDANRQADVVAALLRKYQADTESLLSFGAGRPFDPEPAVVAVPIATISGRSSGGGLKPRTRPGRL